MQHRKLTSGRPPGTDGSDYSYRMMVGSPQEQVQRMAQVFDLWRYPPSEPCVHMRRNKRAQEG
ncbi:hypothetical protein JHK87_000756 [Glycine soja]|nr:hypothetical protein JHK87_000756 [Glycine soja]